MKNFPKSWLILVVLVLAALMMIVLISGVARAAGPWYVAPGGSDNNSCLSAGSPCATLNGAIGKASSGDTIYVATGTYTNATGSEGVLIDKDTTLSGGWDAAFTTQIGMSMIDGQSVQRGISVTLIVTATIERFIIQNGYAYSGGGIYNRGILTLNNSAVSDNASGIGGGGGGGIYNHFGTLILNNSAVSDNASGIGSGGGGGIYNYYGTLTLNHSTVSGNTSSFGGGGISNNRGILTLNNSTVSGNKGSGGGISNDFGTLTLNNSTVSGNTGGSGGGIASHNQGILNLNNSTVSGNTAGIGGGIYIFSSSVLTMQNSILAGNNTSYGYSPDCHGVIVSYGYNLIGDTTGCDFTPGIGDLTDVDADLGQLIGSPGYHPLLSDSPAIDAGNPAGCTDHLGNPLDTDQRGVARVGPCDMGSYEYTPPGPAASISVYKGSPQNVPPRFPFSIPFQAVVLDAIGTPVNAVSVTFTAPASGASGTFADSGRYTTTAVTDECAIVTAATFMANDLRGSYQVTATVPGVITPANFLLSNFAWYVASFGDDDQDCQTPATPCATINGALNKDGFAAGNHVLVASGTYTSSTGNEVVLIDKSASLYGGWDATFNTQNGMTTIDGQGARRGITVDGVAAAFIERFVIQNGYSSTFGGGISNGGNLTLNDSTLSDNRCNFRGGGIYNDGSLILNNSTLSGNANRYYGGGIYNSGALTLNHSTVSGNTGSGGGGIYNEYGALTLNDSIVDGNSDGGIFNYDYGTLILNNSTVSDNTGSNGGIFNINGTLTLNNSTVSGNTGSDGGGIYNTADGFLYLNNSTISGNLGRLRGGGISNGPGARAFLLLQNSILAGNTTFGTGPDCYGYIYSSGYNLIGDTTGCYFTPGIGDLTDVDADLGQLIGSPGYHPLLSGSPAIDAGNPAGCTDHLGNPLDTDQRGIARVGPCDMGSYEYTPPGPAVRISVYRGSPQTAPPRFPFSIPLQAVVLDAIGTPVNAVSVAFTAPVSGASGTFADSRTYTTTAVTDESGIATAATFTANDLRGAYQVTATASGVITSANFLLSNFAWYVASFGDDDQDCQTPVTPCATLNGTLNKDGFTAGDSVFVASGTYTSSTGNEVVLIDKSARLYGGWDATFNTQDGMTTIDGEGARRGITVDDGVTAAIERFVTQNGDASYSGSGIHNFGILTLNYNTIRGNRGSVGSGIYNGGSLTLNNSTVSSNTSQNYGGGIFNGGSLTLNNSTVNGNTSQNKGGGVFSNGTLILNNSTLSGNTSQNGGGIYNSGTLTLSNTTISGNTSQSDGGGIYNYYDTLFLQNSILAGNTTFGTGPDCSGVINSLGYNLIQDTADCTISGTTTGNLTGVVPLLGPLGDNGGSTWTHALLNGSPAIDAGDNINCPTTDQRGIPRPLDGNGDGQFVCDIGSFEFEHGLFLQPRIQFGSGAPDGMVEYTLELYNSTNLTDTYSLALGAHVWDTALSSGMLGTISPGMSQTFTLSVSIPLTATWYLTDSVVVTATSFTSPTIYSATARVTTQSYAPPQISLSPTSLSSMQYGREIITQTLTISNGFGVTLTFNISDSVAWLIIDPVYSVVPTEASDLIQVTFDARDLQPDTYTTSLMILSNDPLRSLVQVPVTMTVLQPVAPISVVISGTAEGVIGGSSSFTASVSPISTTLPLTYTWQTSGQIPITHTGDLSDAVAYTWDSPGIQVITVTASNSAGMVTVTYTLTVTDMPITGLAAFNNSPTLLGVAATFTATIEVGTNVGYTWDFGDESDFQTGEWITHTYAAPGMYTATVTASNSHNQLSANTIVSILQPEVRIYIPLIYGGSVEALQDSVDDYRSGPGLAGLLLLGGAGIAGGMLKRKI